MYLKVLFEYWQKEKPKKFSDFIHLFENSRSVNILQFLQIPIQPTNTPYKESIISTISCSCFVKGLFPYLSAQANVYGTGLYANEAHRTQTYSIGRKLSSSLVSHGSSIELRRTTCRGGGLRHQMGPVIDLIVYSINYLRTETFVITLCLAFYFLGLAND